MTNLRMNNLAQIVLIFILHLPLLLSHAAINNITNSRSLRDSENEKLVSKESKFQLGFFSLNNSRNRYLGIWYFNQTPSYDSVVWVANRARHISDKSGVLKIADDGNLELVDGRGKQYWSSNVSVSPADSLAELQDTGNLVLSSRNHVGENYRFVWKSFDNLTDTFIPGMRVIFSASTREFRVIESWKTLSDPSPGNFSMGIDPQGAPQIVIWEGLKRRWRSGHWDKQKFIGIPNMSSSVEYGFDIDSEGGGNLSFVYNYSPKGSSDLFLFRLGWDGYEELLEWDERKQKWIISQKQPNTQCDLYNKCGNFGMCKTSRKPICDCIEGFKPKDQKEWDREIWESGCVREVSLDCHRNGSTSDGFKPFKNVKLPDFADHVDANGKEDCEEKCLENCSCTAYAYANGISCMLWDRELIDMQQFPTDGATLHLRLAASQIDGKSSSDGKHKVPDAVIAVVVIAGAGLVGIVAWLVWRFKAKRGGIPASVSIPQQNKLKAPGCESSKSKERSAEVFGPNYPGEENQVKGAELPFYSFSDVVDATNNFSEENKLGKGGFGVVYKGMLPNGQEVAVKRLAGRSGQGLEEIKNEIRLIAKLQHINLVSLLGCCVEGEEYMLLYEYMPNKSLDFFLFDATNAVLLDWRKRFAIIEGIARGLIYLHRNSRLRIIHRDLKTSNILLDEEMNPKISDFGIARIFGRNENEANTIRVVGTYGYMSPEYAMEGLFSTKSDVYSFGVIALEVVSGRRNTSFRSSEHSNLLAYAWSLWKDGRAIELADTSIRASCSEDEVLRCIHIGMLCVQDSAASRPTMSQVVNMLESEDTTLPQPEQPHYRRPVDIEEYIEGPDTASMNNLTATVIHGR